MVLVEGGVVGVDRDALTPAEVWYVRKVFESLI